MLITAVDAPKNMASATHRKHPHKSLAVLLKIRLPDQRLSARPVSREANYRGLPNPVNISVTSNRKCSPTSTNPSSGSRRRDAKYKDSSQLCKRSALYPSNSMNKLGILFGGRAAGPISAGAPSPTSYRSRRFPPHTSKRATKRKSSCNADRARPRPLVRTRSEGRSHRLA